MSVIFCNKKVGNNSRCSQIATVSVSIISQNTGKTHKVNRCDKHRCTSTQNKKVVPGSETAIDQSKEVAEVTDFLRSFIGKEVTSNWHRNKFPFIGKYVKDVGIMCQQTKTGKWQYVYYNQITQH